MKLCLLAVMVLAASALFANSKLDDLLKKANEGDAWSQCNLGEAYYLGLYGAGKNYTKAAEWFEKAARQEIIEAKFWLGKCYYFGYGREKSYNDAAYWYRDAAEKGYPEAQFSLGLCYQKGEGVSQSAQDAAKWIAKAAAQGQLEAQLNLARRYAEGDGVTRALETAIEWQRTANRQEDMDGRQWLSDRRFVRLGDGLMVLGGLLETGRYVDWTSLSDEDKVRFLRSAVAIYPEDLFRTNNYWWRYTSKDEWFCRTFLCVGSVWRFVKIVIRRRRIGGRRRLGRRCEVSRSLRGRCGRCGTSKRRSKPRSPSRPC